MSDADGAGYDPKQVADAYRHAFAARLDAYSDWHEQPGCAHGERCECHWTALREELTVERVVAGLGKNGRPVSGYMSDGAGFTHVAAMDLDRPDGWELGLKVAATLADAGAFPMPEHSRRGAHVWLVLDRQLAADTVRVGLREFVRRTDPYAAKDPKVELRPPKLERQGPDSLGTPLRLPMMRHPATGKRYPLCAPDGTPLGSSVSEAVLGTELTPADLLEEAASEAHTTTDEARPPEWSRRPMREAGDVVELLVAAGVPNAAPGRAVKCPLHDDNRPSLSVSRDSERVWCKSPSCEGYNGGRGLGADQLARALRAVHAGA